MSYQKINKFDRLFPEILANISAPTYVGHPVERPGGPAGSSSFTTARTIQDTVELLQFSLLLLLCNLKVFHPNFSTAIKHSRMAAALPTRIPVFYPLRLWHLESFKFFWPSQPAIQVPVLYASLFLCYRKKGSVKHKKRIKTSAISRLMNADWGKEGKSAEVERACQSRTGTSTAQEATT